MHRSKTRIFSTVVSACALACAGATGAQAASASDTATTGYSGTLADSAQWIAQVPANWNGTVVLFSHGFGPLAAQDAPSAGSAVQLLAQGYALVGSSYDENGSWWALDTAAADQFQTLDAFLQASGLRPHRTLAVGVSMGGLINSLIDQQANGRVQGAVTFCGLVAGGTDLNDFQLNAEYAMTELLPGASGVRIRDYASMADGSAAGTQLSDAVTAAQSTAAGRARVALAAALLNESDWTTSATPPAAQDYAGQEVQEEQMLTSGQLPFIESGRYMISLAEGGDSGSNIGVDYGALIRASPYYAQIKALYRASGLDLDADLATLDHHETYASEGDSLARTRATSDNTGRLQVPELDVHTVSDQLAPVQFEATYAQRVARAGDSGLLRQTYVNAVGHCDFTDADYVAAIDAMNTVVAQRQWTSGVTVAGLNRAADALDPTLGGGDFTAYRNTPLDVQN
ncbi:alpha/beta hydrolase [Actinospica durhamensis]|uniref:Alpha/beta hydrolase n=1 Tax=Actinospica durhamensis TaxID=1508375 RepID=A0A941IPP2_9ACTN|nr:alpha/beta hydrolase [Actinospica durhamensis]MBR7833322.1 alpha/beta hydrolase [Actinospica durhamensis]